MEGPLASTVENEEVIRKTERRSRKKSQNEHIQRDPFSLPIRRADAAFLHGHRTPSLRKSVSPTGTYFPCLSRAGSLASGASFPLTSLPFFAESPAIGGSTLQIHHMRTLSGDSGSVFSGLCS